MCCGASNYRTLSLLVGWLSVAFSAFSVIYYTSEVVAFQQRQKLNAEPEEAVENGSTSDFQTILDNSRVQHNIISIAVCVFLWFVPSILLVKGIKQNRRILVAPWLFIAYVSVALYSIFLFYTIWGAAAFTGSLRVGFMRCLPLSFALIFSILCIHCVRKFYKILSIPPPVLPIYCVMGPKKTEDHQHYMPVFKN